MKNKTTYFQKRKMSLKKLAEVSVAENRLKSTAKSVS